MRFVIVPTEFLLENGGSGGRRPFNNVGRAVLMLCMSTTEHVAAEAVATVLLDFRAHPETAGPVE
jgi:hypothetical protein